MKKRFITVSKALACSAVLAAMFSCNNQKTTTPISNSGAAADGIAYVYVDSLLNDYDLYNDEMNKFFAKQKQYDQDLQSKMSSLQRRATELQQNLEKRLITPTSYQEKGQQLAMEEQRLQQTYQQQAMELQDDQAQIMGRVGDSVRNYINEYNATKGYKMIISTTGASTVLYGDPSLNITSDLVKGLNERYRGTSASATPQAAADTTASK
ncbi:MAG: OmpH family outer membrane protein [Bacteroidales bacterium]|nr:OmpH family outer membrane protein [Bacteroidales bacterium]